MNNDRLTPIIDEAVFQGYKGRLKNKLYSLLCEREENGKWERFLENLVIELMGYARELNSINYWALIGKMCSLKYLSYEYFRSTIFECMSLISTDL